MRNRRTCKGRLLHNAMVGLTAVVGLGIIVLLMAAKFVVEPNLEHIAQIRAETVVTRTINKALAQQFEGNKGKKDFFDIKKNTDGKVEVVQADSIAINIMMTELSSKIQESFKKMEAEPYYVPLGSLMGSKLFSQLGPDVGLKIIPLSVSSMDFRTEFESEGINQTKFKIYIELTCRIRVLAPFSSETFNSSHTIPVAEAVILGEVPHSFVQVPQEDILDVTEE